jgi:hypothetical protein
MQKTAIPTKNTLNIIKKFRIQLITLFLRPLKLNDHARCRKTVVLEKLSDNSKKQYSLLLPSTLAPWATVIKHKHNLNSP